MGGVGDTERQGDDQPFLPSFIMQRPTRFLIPLTRLSLRHPVPFRTMSSFPKYSEARGKELCENLQSVLDEVKAAGGNDTVRLRSLASSRTCEDSIGVCNSSISLGQARCNLQGRLALAANE